MKRSTLGVETMSYAEFDRLNKGQKLVRILEWLQRRGGVRVTEIRDRFGLTPRTFRRYLADLRDLGLPLQESGVGEERVIAVDPRYRRSGIQLTLGEMLSLRLGRTFFNFLEGTDFVSDIDQAIDRLDATVSRADVEVVKEFDNLFVAVPEPQKDYRENADLIDDILSALLHRNPGIAEYVPSGKDPKRYRLEPLSLAIYRQGLYLFARDASAGIVKTFAVERFSDFRRLRKEKFVRPAGWDSDKEIESAFGIYKGTPEKIVVRFAATEARYIQERLWHRSQRIVPLDDGGVEIHLKCAIGPELRQWVLGYGASAEVIEPPAFRQEIAERVAAASALYQNA